ncbi:hypothetical protein ACHAXN_007148 [Cyclotella atomus]
MGRYCSDCGDWCSNRSFSRNQWMKGDGYSRCKDCVDGGSHFTGLAYHVPSPPVPRFQCGECYREFNNQNELNMHMQVHRPRDVACPICGERRFKTGANAVQHVESGYCSGCSGADNARRQIYEFAQRQGGMQRYLTGTPQLTHVGSSNGVPDMPYQCRECNKSFRNLSQLMQHQDQKHNNLRLLGY